MGFKKVTLRYFKDGTQTLKVDGELRKTDPEDFTRDKATEYFPAIWKDISTHDAIVAEAGGHAFIFLNGTALSGASR